MRRTTALSPAGQYTDPADLRAAIYRTAAVARAAEDCLTRHIAEERGFPGFWHPGYGHEVLQAAVVAGLRPDDWLLPSHRGIGAVFGKGMSLDEIFGDLFCRTTGSTGGKGAGTVHYCDPSVGVLGMSGTLGGGFVVGAGAALSCQLLGQDRVCCHLFGDGTAGRGPFHEALLEASSWKLPLVLVCENNGWALSAPFRAHSPTEHVSDRAAAYGIPGVRVDGGDALAVYEAVSEAVARAREGGGPTLLEAKVVRRVGHFAGDQQHYRTDLGSLPDDPVARLRRELDGDTAAAIDEESRAAVDAAYRNALTGPEPGLDVVLRDVWA